MAADNPAPPAPSPPLGIPVRVWIVVITACGVLASLLFDAFFEPLIIIAYAATGVGLVVFYRFRAHADQRSWLLVCLQGLFLSGALFVCNVFAWLVAEIVSRGRSPEVVLWPARLALAYSYGAVFLWLLKKRRGLIREIARLAVLWMIGLGLVAYLVYCVGFTGPDDPSTYPPPSETPYRLPWKPGHAFACTQANFSPLSHGGWQKYAYDFVMPVGTEVCAVRAGQVFKVVDHHDGNGPNSPGNYVDIIHADGTIAEYVHIRQGGSRVRAGQFVQQGDVIAESGNVGYSLQAHLHFHVVKNRTTIPVSFSDVPGDGIPRSLRRYVSGNVQTRQ